MRKKYFNWSIVGHSHILEALSAAILNNRLSHAYLFWGPSGLGKMTTALQLAQILQCQSKDKKPCLKCAACQQIQNRLHPDTQIIEDKESINIEEIRMLQHNLSLNPYNSPYKIAILDNASAMTFEAQNAFLKTLEEPPGKTIIILINKEDAGLLPTIISRCQIIGFSLVAKEQIKEFLKSKFSQLKDQQLEELARLAGGRPGLALRMVDNSELVEQRKEIVKFFSCLPENSYLERFNWLSQSSKDKKATELLLEFLLTWFRDLLLLKLGLIDLITNITHLSLLKKEASLYKIPEIKKIINKILKTQESLKYNANLKLLLESLFLFI